MMQERQTQIAENLKTLMVENLKLPMKPEEIDTGASLLGDGLGLDSVDLIELVSLVYNEYQVIMTNEHWAYFKNIDSMSEFICNKLMESN